ncbi:MAG TPA: DNA polymerase III subunit delta [Capillimicrobium sp.]|nr:DNA polymerase III subunit delta [Capillimicrobium sp.]
MPTFKPAYLVHGDDHARIAQRRANLRALAEREGGISGAELFEGEDATPENVALALSAMTFATGRRFLIVEGVERWKDKEVTAHLAPIMGALPPETTVAFFGREEGRTKVPAALAEAVRAAGGDVATETAVKPWELPKWVIAQARTLDLQLDQSAARALVAHVGERQARLMRELETLALELGPGATVDQELIDERAADSAERRVWELADLLVAGDAAGATRTYLELRAQGERLPGLMYWMTQRVRQALDVVTRLEAGEAPAEIKRGLRMPPKAADRFLNDVRRADVASLRRALRRLSDLELASRGGTQADEDTSAVRAILAIAS